MKEERRVVDERNSWSVSDEVISELSFGLCFKSLISWKLIIPSWLRMHVNFAYKHVIWYDPLCKMDYFQMAF